MERMNDPLHKDLIYELRRNEDLVNRHDRLPRDIENSLDQMFEFKLMRQTLRQALWMVEITEARKLEEINAQIERLQADDRS
jgi:hypothetical protein